MGYFVEGFKQEADGLFATTVEQFMECAKACREGKLAERRAADAEQVASLQQLARQNESLEAGLKFAGLERADLLCQIQSVQSMHQLEGRVELGESLPSSNGQMNAAVKRLPTVEESVQEELGKVQTELKANQQLKANQLLVKNIRLEDELATLHSELSESKSVREENQELMSQLESSCSELAFSNSEVALMQGELSSLLGERDGLVAELKALQEKSREHSTELEVAEANKQTANIQQYQLELQVESLAQFSAQQVRICVEAAAANVKEMARLNEALVEADAALRCQLEADATMRIETSRMEAELKGLVELEEMELLSLNMQLAECSGQQRELEQQLQLANAELAQCAHQLVQCQEEKANAAEVAEATAMDNNAQMQAIETALGTHKVEVANGFGQLMSIVCLTDDSAAQKNDDDQSEEMKDMSLADRVAADLGELLGHAKMYVSELLRLAEVEQKLIKITNQHDALKQETGEPTQNQVGCDVELSKVTAERYSRLTESVHVCRAIVRFFRALALFALGGAIAVSFFSFPVGLIPFYLVVICWIAFATAMVFAASARFTHFWMTIQNEIGLLSVGNEVNELHIGLLKEHTSQRSQLGTLRLLLSCVLLLALTNFVLLALDQKLI